MMVIYALKHQYWLRVHGRDSNVLMEWSTDYELGIDGHAIDSPNKLCYLNVYDAIRVFCQFNGYYGLLLGDNF